MLSVSSGSSVALLQKALRQTVGLALPGSGLRWEAKVTLVSVKGVSSQLAGS